MKHLYIDSSLRTLALAARQGTPPGDWIFSEGRPWLLVTPRRLRRLAGMLSPDDERLARIRTRIERESAFPDTDAGNAGDADDDRSGNRPGDPSGKYPLAVCPVCDSVHRPHPLDAGLACPACQAREEERRRHAPTPGMEEDMRRDAEIRRLFLENFPESFVDGELSPNWRYNYERRLERDWEAAMGRILMGATYKRVAGEFGCSVGLLHRKVTEKMSGKADGRKHWESN